jgi:hypothetical protein
MAATVAPPRPPLLLLCPAMLMLAVLAATVDIPKPQLLLLCVVIVIGFYFVDLDYPYT